MPCNKPRYFDGTVLPPDRPSVQDPVRRVLAQPLKPGVTSGHSGPGYPLVESSTRVVRQHSLGISCVPAALRRPQLRLTTAVSPFCDRPLSWPGSRLELTGQAVPL